MKKTILLFCSMLLMTYGFCQVIYDINRVPPLKKGKIILLDGSVYNFSQLNVDNDTVKFIRPQVGHLTFPAEDVYSISRTGTYAVDAFIFGGGLGLGRGISEILKEDYNPEILKPTTTVLIMTFTTAITAGIVGAFIKKDKTIYKNQTAFSLNLRAGNNNNSNHIMLSLIFNL